MNVSIADAKNLLDDLVRRAEAGEHVILTRDGRPVAELGPAPDAARTKASIVGAMRGEFWMAADFDELGPEWDEYRK